MAQTIVEKHGVDRLLFGSDMPWHRPAWELKLLRSLELPEADMEKILWRNAKKLLKL